MFFSGEGTFLFNTNAMCRNYLRLSIARKYIYVPIRRNTIKINSIFLQFYFRILRDKLSIVFNLAGFYLETRGLV